MPEPTALPATHGPGTTQSPWGTALSVAGITALGFNLRARLTSLPPVFPGLAASLHLSSASLALLAAAALLAAGLLPRGVMPSAMLFPGTNIAAGAIACLNVLLPGPIKRRQADQAGPLIGIYPLSLCGGALRTTPGSPAPRGERAPGPLTVSRHLLAWQVMAFMGLQSLTYYAALSWLPILFGDRGAGAVDAGALLALMNAGRPGALTPPGGA
jgi:MFS transporter, CP family, cyanate transporter